MTSRSYAAPSATFSSLRRAAEQRRAARRRRSSPARGPPTARPGPSTSTASPATKVPPTRGDARPPAARHGARPRRVRHRRPGSACPGPTWRGRATAAGSGAACRWPRRGCRPRHPTSAAAACSAEVSTTSMPAPVAIRAASTLVVMPPVPTPDGPGGSDGDRGEVLLRPHDRDQARPVAAGRAVVEAVDVGEQDQQVGVDEVGDQRGEPVVVAEADLGGGDGVVLVDDRHDAELEQLGEGLVGVAVVGAPGHVVDGEQHLAGHDAVPGELLLVAVGQQALARPTRRPAGRRARGAAW